MSDTDGQVLRIERTFTAAAEEVFDAWTSAEVMRRWFHVRPDWETPVADVDGNVLVAVAARVGDVRLIDNTLIGRH